MRRRRRVNSPTTPEAVLGLYRQVLTRVPEGGTRVERAARVNAALSEWGIDLVDVIRARIWERSRGEGRRNS